MISHGPTCLCTMCHVDRVRAQADAATERQQTPERPVHWTWLHGKAMPAMSPREVAEARTGVPYGRTA